MRERERMEMEIKKEERGKGREIEKGRIEENRVRRLVRRSPRGEDFRDL